MERKIKMGNRLFAADNLSAQLRPVIQTAFPTGCTTTTNASSGSRRRQVVSDEGTARTIIIRQPVPSFRGTIVKRIAASAAAHGPIVGRAAVMLRRAAWRGRHSAPVHELSGGRQPLVHRLLAVAVARLAISSKNTGERSEYYFAARSRENNMNYFNKRLSKRPDTYQAKFAARS